MYDYKETEELSALKTLYFRTTHTVYWKKTLPPTVKNVYREGKAKQINFTIIGTIDSH